MCFKTFVSSMKNTGVVHDLCILYQQILKNLNSIHSARFKGIHLESGVESELVDTALTRGESKKSQAAEK